MPENQHKKVKKEVGDFVKEEILRSLSEGQSPVAGESFKKLNAEYAKAEKGGDRTPNLELDGDLLDALVYKDVAGGIEIGVFKASEIGKADGHNKWNLANNNKIPKRRFIPKGNQNFDQEIMSGISSIVNEFKVTPLNEDPFKSILTVEDTVDKVDIQIGDLFNDDFFKSFLAAEGIDGQ